MISALPGSAKSGDPSVFRPLKNLPVLSSNSRAQFAQTSDHARAGPGAERHV